MAGVTTTWRWRWGYTRCQAPRSTLCRVVLRAGGDRVGSIALRKIDCVMILVDDLDRAAAYYTRVFGVQRAWTRPTQIGLRMPETDAEIVLHTDRSFPSRVEVHYLVDDVAQAVAHFQANGCRVLVEPFDIEIGKCASIEDPFGTRLNILDMTKGPLKP